MADELIIEPSSEPSEAQKRITQLSDKVRITSEEREVQKALVTERDKTIADLQKENTFNSGFADILGQHPAAKDHKDEIKAKVLSGYSPEDAAYAVLGKAGKLGAAKPQEIASPAGGSASFNPPQGGSKKLEEMTREEKRAAILQAEREGGISLT